MKKSILFSVLAIGCFFIVDRGLSYILDILYSKTKTGQTGGKINYYLSLDTLPEMVIMGNSRALYQVIPDSFKVSTYNLSHAGMHQIFQTGLLGILNNQKKMPSCILLHLEPEEFTGKQFNRDIQNLKYYYSKDMVITKKINELSRFEKYKFYFDSYRYNGRVIPLLKNYLQSQQADIASNGYAVIIPNPKDSINTLYSVTIHDSRPEEKFNFEQWSYLENFLDICEQHGTTVICFTSPVYTNIQSNPITGKIISKLLSKRNIAYINYLQHPITKLAQHPSLWKDSYHLNHLGACVESETLAKDVDQILKNKKRQK